MLRREGRPDKHFRGPRSGRAGAAGAGCPRGGGPYHRPIMGARAFLLFLGTMVPILSRAEPAAPSPVAAGEMLWRGRPDGLLRAAGERPFDLAPDGRSFVYLQGAPWPRAALQRIAPEGQAGTDPVALGGLAAFGSRPPRFDQE